MALTITNGGAISGTRTPYKSSTTIPSTHFLFRRHPLFPPSNESRTLHVVHAKKSSSSRTGRFDSKNRRGSTTIKEQEQEEEEEERNRAFEIERDSRKVDNGVVFDLDENMPKLPGPETDFWEGPQWEPFGFFLQYLWAFGILFALVACGISVVTYNEGATDFKDTPAYKESVQSRDLLEEPEASNPDVFESNPTEVAPSLE